MQSEDQVPEGLGRRSVMFKIMAKVPYRFWLALDMLARTV